METQNSNTETKNQIANTVEGKVSNVPASSYDYFLKSYKNCKIADSKDLEAHKVVVRNFLNAHNREFKEIAPIKKWLEVLNSEKFFPRRTSSKKFSLFYTLQGINKALKKGSK